ncbi:MAG: PD-(D/E)XK nuclease family protein [Methylotenera sp.]|nr:PD-(D/E)XK nuclease family protein [Methylotenera sp.]MDO9233621.1 PD-(D/E)XK nuclease family protein [Methylotenera sp.]MDP2101055.1 PD-(D/E)XK nuclease family protein [Methylotenera sp.]MDP2281844.1 PD-(D/E)XK nuclease family protein [Methylotenera sp.]MDP2403734.1 PD-(D/E)XK nuclease family protein [Methylotenera sp.]
MQNQIQTLLNDVAFKVGTLKKANELFSDRLAPNFNIFDYLRTDEMGFSRCVASLLNPTGTHGQGSLFLEDFLKRIDKDLFLTELDNHWTGVEVKGCQVGLEKQANGQRRIDVYLRFKNGEIIGIENKPWAWDQKDQLKDYAQFIEKEAKCRKWLLIYLSNNDPTNSEYSINKEQREKLEKSGNFIWLDYSELIEWFEYCSQKSKALVVRVFIEELAKFTRMKINGALDMSEEKEIKNIILKSKENIESAFHISKAIKAAKVDLLEKLRIDLNESLTTNRFVFLWDEQMTNEWKSYTGFDVKFHEEQSLYLRFNFESSDLRNLIWGIRKGKSIKKDAEIWNKINSVMNDKFGAGGKTEWWPWWNYIHNNNDLFSEDFRHWDKNEGPWLSIINREIVAKITTLAISVREVFNENPDILTGDVTLTTSID